jgi:GH24 family phage-related lysozyme (muramidase)
MKANFNLTFEFIMRSEGCKMTNDKDDPGGLTAPYGLTLAAMITYKMDLNKDGKVDEKDVYLVDKDVALGAFKKHYWDRLDGDNLAGGFDLFLTDWAYNAGVGVAAKRKGITTLEELKSNRDAFYESLVEKKPVLKKYIKGWLNRSRNAYNEALKCEG